MKIGFFTQMERLIRSPSLRIIRKQLMKKLKQSGKTAANEANLSDKDRTLIRHIQERTRRLNVNNVTRTTAYYDYYLNHSEVEWAFLGHMVSRNGGWSMTDLRGELLSKLLSETEQNNFFRFLERGNWLIFQDAYPQFLLYEESLRRNTALFHLLPHFHVSAFMEVMWEHFWTSGDRYLLTMALVINEQSYLEKRVIQNDHYQSTILGTFPFKLQELLRLNQILFPYHRGRGLNKGAGQAVGMIGETLRHFGSLHERIMLGKRLYNVLFGSPEHLRGVLAWAKEHPHTGSRKDYWPHVFNDVNESAPGAPYKKRMDDCRIQPGSPRLYSPSLQHAWKNFDHKEAEPGDWFDDWKVIDYFMKDEEKGDGDIGHEYCKTLEKIEFAVIAKSVIF
jgi:hypothetical protein